MARFRLQALAPGKRLVPQADGSRSWVEFTPEYVAAHVERNNAMIRAGIPVPVSWEHRSDAKPGSFSVDDWKSAKTKGVAGHALGYALENGRAFADVEIPDDDDGKQAMKVRFCSPEIDQFTDGDGREWGEVFTHLALTPRPVQYDQPPIARLSFTGPLRLAIDPYKGTDMADEKAKDEGEEKPKEETEKKPDLPEPPKPGEFDEAEFKALIEALRNEGGLTIPDEVVNIRELTIAVKASGAADEAPFDETEVVPEAGPGGGGGMAMSHTKPAKPATTATTPATPPHPALAKQEARAAAHARKNIVTRIDACFRLGQIDPRTATALKSEATKVQLSFGDDGEVASNDLLVKLAAFESLPKGQTWRRRGRQPVNARLSHVEPPKGLEDGDTPDESEAGRKSRSDAFFKTSELQRNV